MKSDKTKLNLYVSGDGLTDSVEAVMLQENK